MPPINISIDGLPAAKGDWVGNKKNYAPHNKEKFYAWENLIKKTARAAYSPTAPSQADIELKIRFFMPASRDNGARTTRPDIDKLARTVMDALEGIVYADDSQVVRLTAEKEYTMIHGSEGAEIEVSDIRGME